MKDFARQLLRAAGKRASQQGQERGVPDGFHWFEQVILAATQAAQWQADASRISSPGVTLGQVIRCEEWQPFGPIFGTIG